MKALAKYCEPDTYEGRIAQKWMRDHSFRAETNPKLLPFAVVLPPPDPAGAMHLGQAFSMVLQDLMIRRQRMSGCSALWIPCMDSAALSAEAETIRALAGSGLTKNAVSREDFRAQTAERTGRHITAYQQQMLRLGCSCDWERAHHTTDAACTEAVREAFVRYYEDGYLRRGKCITDWCPACRTAITAAEFRHEERPGTRYKLRYPFTDGSGYLFLMTSQPETIFGDAAAAVNPKDIRYRNIIGKTILLPLTGRSIPVIGDSAVPMDEGTGVVRVTPACNAHDYLLAQQHGLQITEPLTESGQISADYPEFAGLTPEKAAEAVRNALKAGGFLVKSEPAAENAAVCCRCGTKIRQRLRMRWFLRTSLLAEPAADALKEGRIRFVPAHFAGRCLTALKEAQDQCISHAAWWGIPVPAVYCKNCGEMIVSADPCESCPKCGGDTEPDPDTLETGFANALLPFAVLGYPGRTDDLQYYYPTDTLLTGYDLLTPWVSGMLAAALQLTDEIPFKQVVLHGLLRDSAGKKITAERKNGYAPEALIADHGADALRFAMIAHAAPGRDLRLTESQVIAAKRLADKLWNGARCVIENLPASFRYTGLPASLRIEEAWIVSELNQLAGQVNDCFARCAFGNAAGLLSRFIRKTFCGQYLMLAKARLRADYDGRETAEQVMMWVLRSILCLMHPFMPFVTEEIWQALTDSESSVITEACPVYQTVLDFSQTAKDFAHVIAALQAVRRHRSALHIPKNMRAKFYFDTLDVDLFSASRIFFEQLAGAAEIEFGQDYRSRNALNVITERAHIVIPVEQMLIRDREHLLLTRQAEKLRKEAEPLQALLHQPEFCRNAPEPVVRAMRERRAVLREQLVRLVSVLS